MKTTVKTSLAAVTIEPGDKGLILIRVKPSILPEVQMTFTPDQAAAIATALDLCATAQELAYQS